MREDSDVYFLPCRTCGFVLTDCGYLLKKGIDKMSDINYDLTMQSKKKGQKVAVLANNTFYPKSDMLIWGICISMFYVLYGYNITCFLKCQ